MKIYEGEKLSPKDRLAQTVELTECPACGQSIKWPPNQNLIIHCPYCQEYFFGKKVLTDLELDSVMDEE
jgi:hypothetical protein